MELKEGQRIEVKDGNGWLPATVTAVYVAWVEVEVTGIKNLRWRRMIPREDADRVCRNPL